MCDDTDNELDEGEKLAFDLAVHLTNMGAAKAAIPVELEGQQYLVTVERADNIAQTSVERYGSMGQKL